MSCIARFQPHQILCLEHDSTALYAEVIQIIPERGLCWVRPLALLHLKPFDRAFQVAPLQAGTLQDLRQTSDLLYPQSLFRAALDTEVVPVLTELNTLKPPAEGSSAASLKEDHSARHQLQDFIRGVWQSNPEAFQP
ncbi:MAG TPA: hypothetical protein V6C65_15300 [Allocoleopsis sp.]